MITENFRRRILSNLHGKHTRTEDFNHKIIGRSSGEMKIYYRYNPQYSFTIYLNNQGVTGITYSPGSIMKEEEYKSTTNPESKSTLTGLSIFVNEKPVEIDLDIENTLEKVSEWISNIEDEMATTPESRILKEHDEQIRNMEEQLNEFFEGKEDSQFNYDEIIELREKLNEMEENFKEKFEENNEKYEINSKLISELQKEIASLKVQSNVLSKQNWAKSFFSRMYKFQKKYPKVTSLLLVGMYSALPEDLKMGLPEGYVQILLPDITKIESQEDEKEED